MKKTKEMSRPEKFKARTLDGHHRDCILLLFFGLAHRAPLFVFFFFLSDSRIVSHSPFVFKWQNRFWYSELVIARFSSKKGETLDIRIPRNPPKLHPAPCMCDVCRVCGLGPSRTSKQNVLSLILLIPSTKLTN